MKHVFGRLRSIDSAPTSAQSQDKVYAVALAGCVLAGALLRLHGLSSLPLNFDEGATLYFAHLPFADLWGGPAILETNPPLFYSVERCAVLLLGSAEWVLRLPSAIAGTLSVLVVAGIARNAGGRLAGIAAAAMLSDSAVSIACSQDARTYSLLTLAALLAIWAELLLLQTHRRAGQVDVAAHGGAWATYILSCIAALYLHNTAIVLIIAFNLMALVAWVRSPGASRRFVSHWTVANAVVLGAYAFWLPIVVRQSMHALSSFWIPVPTLSYLRYAMMNVFAQPYIRTLQPAVDAIFIGTGVVGILIRPRRPDIFALAMAVLLGVPLMSWAISQWRPIMNGKTLLPLTPVFLVFVALGCTHVRRFAVIATVSAVVLQLAACYGYFHSRYDEAYPEVAAVLQAKAHVGDAIFLDPPSNELLLAYYGWPRDRLSLLAPTGPDSWFRGFDGRRMEQSALSGTAGPSGRIWVLTRSHFAEHRAIASLFGGRMTEEADQIFGHGYIRSSASRNLELSLFVPRK